jgi:hypothetical protein
VTYTGKYLGDYSGPDILVWEPAFPKPDVSAVDEENLSRHISLENIEQVFITLLRMMEKAGLHHALPTTKIEGQYIPLTFEAFNDLNESAQEAIIFLPLKLVVTRLVWEKDEELLPPELARRLFQFMTADLPEEPVTMSFCDAAGLVLVEVGADSWQMEGDDEIVP